MNGLLASLPPDERSRALSLFQAVTIERGAILHDVGDSLSAAYFPTDGLISLISLMRDGRSLELASVGADGMVAIQTVFGADTAQHQAVAQVRLPALRISVSRLRAELERNVALRQVLLHYGSHVVAQISQSAMCHRFHTGVQRLARWLLCARDRLQSDVIHVTQESVGTLLGSPRTSVTTATVVLEDRGAIRQRHGRTFILDPVRLRDAACECYALPGRRIHAARRVPNGGNRSFSRVAA